MERKEKVLKNFDVTLKHIILTSNIFLQYREKYNEG